MNPTADPFDELAALFLTDPDPGGLAPTKPLVELLIVGHLPVRAGLWIAPYADGIARRRGPSCLVRLDDAVPHVQVLRGGASDLALVENEPTFHDVVTGLGRRMRTWVVRPSPDLESRELLTAGADRLTILSSGDEAAVVAAYQIIKDLADAAGTTEPIPEIGLALLGCDEDHAAGVVERLNRTTRSFIGVELELVLAMPRMDAGMVSGGYRQFVQDAVPTVGELVGWIDRELLDAAAVPPVPAEGSHVGDDFLEDQVDPLPTSHEHATDESTAATQPGWDTRPPLPVTHVSDAQRAAADRGRRESGDPGQPAESGADVRDDTVDDSGTERWSRSRTVRLRPKAISEIEAKARRDREPSRAGRPIPLCEHVQGLRDLDLRCPGHEHIEIAVDTAGRLHLLGHGDSSVRELPIVQAWSAAHAEILGRACPDAHLTGFARPALHVFTDTPASVADLHGSAMHLHVLAPVQVGEAVGWYSAPLNHVREPGVVPV